MFYVYVLKSLSNGDLYKGYTNDLKRRVQEHNQGVTKTTKTGGPWELIYYEAFISEKAARHEELFLKSGAGRDRLRYILQMEDWPNGKALVSKTNTRKG